MTKNNNPIPRVTALIQKKTKRGRPRKNQPSFKREVLDARERFRDKTGQEPRAAILRRETWTEYPGVGPGLAGLEIVLDDTIKAGDIALCVGPDDFWVDMDRRAGFHVNNDWKDEVRQRKRRKKKPYERNK